MKNKMLQKPFFFFQNSLFQFPPKLFLGSGIYNEIQTDSFRVIGFKTFWTIISLGSSSGGTQTLDLGMRRRVFYHSATIASLGFETFDCTY
jgi:hypothetical protein